MMISIQEALQIVDEQQTLLKVHQLSVEESLGFYIAEEIQAPFDLPSFDNSAMDGYAVCGISEHYEVIGEIQAGNISEFHLSAGEAVRIFTGAKVPSSASAVVMQEQTEVKGKELSVLASISEGQNIRRKGNELRKGDSVFLPGKLINPTTVGLLTSLGLTSISVYKKPIVRIISTGDELIPAGNALQEGQIYESNSSTLASVMQKFGFDCSEKSHLKDDFELIKTNIGKAVDSSDVLLLSGGISVGDYDFVRQALIESGVQELFYRVLQKPGKPLYFGRKDDTFVFALPGNPASSLTCFYVYVFPLLQKLSGAKDTGLMRVNVPLAHDYTMKTDRPSFLKAKIEYQKISILDGQASSMIHSMSMANALCFMHQKGEYRSGDLVECLIID